MQFVAELQRSDFVASLKDALRMTTTDFFIKFMTENIIAFLFPGQGSQAVGMGKDLFDKYPLARQTFEEADDALGYKLVAGLLRRTRRPTSPHRDHAAGDSDRVDRGAARVWRRAIPKPCYVAGHSLGEYSAHVASGTLSFADAVRTVRNRGKYMQEAVPVGVGAMAAILGMDLEKVTAVCHDAAQGEVCEPANINSPEQIVISGNTAAVERAAKLADERGAKRAKLLPVSAPFHCSLMKPAQDRLKADLDALKLQKPVYPVACNVDAELVTDDLRARDTLAPAGHGLGEVGAVHAPADRARRADFR